MTTTSHAFTEDQLDVDLIADVLASVRRTRAGLDSLIVGNSDDVPHVHAQLRQLVGESADTDVWTLPDPAGDLRDILTHLLADYENALTRLHALAEVEATDPVAHYTRLIHAAEKELKGYNSRPSEAPARAQALIAIADRWLSDALINAHHRRTKATTTNAHPTTEVHNHFEPTSWQLADAEALTRWFERLGVEVAAVQDANGALYLLSGHDEDGTFYVGIPQAENEEGTSIDPNKGFIESPARGGRAAPAFPVTIRATGTGASYPHTQA